MFNVLIWMKCLNIKTDIKITAFRVSRIIKWNKTKRETYMVQKKGVVTNTRD